MITRCQQDIGLPQRNDLLEHHCFREHGGSFTGLLRAGLLRGRRMRLRFGLALTFAREGQTNEQGQYAQKPQRKQRTSDDHDGNPFLLKAAQQKKSCY
jgi:hypothetical protein